MTIYSQKDYQFIKSNDKKGALRRKAPNHKKTAMNTRIITVYKLILSHLFITTNADFIIKIFIVKIQNRKIMQCNFLIKSVIKNLTSFFKINFRFFVSHFFFFLSCLSFFLS